MLSSCHLFSRFVLLARSARLSMQGFGGRLLPGYTTHFATICISYQDLVYPMFQSSFRTCNRLA